jgi:lipoprotein LpqH
MKFGVVVTAVAVGILAATAGCAKEIPVPPAPKVTVGGTGLNVSPPVTCAKTDHNVNIAIGQAPTVLSAVLSDADPPQVNSVVFNNVNGETVVYRAGSDQPSPGATATKNGNSYTITGNATVLDSATHPATKDFKIEAVCP